MQERFFDGRVIVKSGDLTLEAVDAIVNAATGHWLGATAAMAQSEMQGAYGYPKHESGCRHRINHRRTDLSYP